MRAPPKLAIVVPCYNEEEGLDGSIDTLKAMLADFQRADRCAPDSFVVLVDDGSRDGTWDVIQRAWQADPKHIVGIKLAANRGHQNALAAGLAYATDTSDASISIDADLQDDLSALGRMLDLYKEGWEIVLGVKNQRDADSRFKQWTAKGFYKVMQAAGIKLQEQHADCRLMSAAAMKNLSMFTEHFLFLRGFPHILHSKVTTVTYDIRERQVGASKYTLRKMISLAINGITSFSVFPLRLISAVGLLVFVVSGLVTAYAIVQWLFGSTVPGWASTIVPIYLLGGINILCLGVVGEYIGKLYVEAKRRPRYLIDTVLDQVANT